MPEIKQEEKLATEPQNVGEMRESQKETADIQPLDFSVEEVRDLISKENQFEEFSQEFEKFVTEPGRQPEGFSQEQFREELREMKQEKQFEEFSQEMEQFVNEKTKQ